MTNFKTQERFGVDAHQKLVSLIRVPPFPEASLGVESGQISITPAASQQVLGSLAGLAIGEALGERAGGRRGRVPDDELCRRVPLPRLRYYPPDRFHRLRE